MSGVDASQDGSPQEPASQKKSPLDNLSRDDLLKKCKSLLTIAQKAKQAKDDALEEVKQTKHKLNINIQDVEKLKQDNDKLALNVRAFAEEKESFLLAIENVKSNNSELQNLVRSINAERDSFFQDITKLTAEKTKLIKVVDMMGGENDAMISENRTLKDDKRKLNEELFTAISERENIESEIKDVKLQLVHLLNNSFGLAKSLNVDISSSVDSSSVGTDKKHTGVICDLIGKSNSNLRLLSDAITQSPSKMNTSVADNTTISDNVSSQMEEIKEQFSVAQSKLCSEIDELKANVLELESRIESFKTENSVLTDELNNLKNVRENDTKLQTELMNELERNRSVLMEKKTEVEHLKEEISVLMTKNKEQTFNAMEMQGTKNLVKQLEIAVAEKEAEREALQLVADEFEESNGKLTVRVESLEQEIKEKEEKFKFLKHEEDRLKNVVSDQSSTTETLQKEVKMLNQAMEENKKALLELEQLRVNIVNIRKELEDKELLLSRTQQESAENESKSTTLIDKQSAEILNLQTLLKDKENELLLTLEQKQSEHDSVMAAHASETNDLRSQVALLEVKVASIPTDFTSPFEAMAESLTKTLVAKEKELVDLQKLSHDKSQQLSNFCLDLDKERDEKTKLEHSFKLKEQELSALQEMLQKERNIATYDIELLQAEIKRLRQCKSELMSSRESFDVVETQNKAYKEEIDVLKAGRDAAVQLLQQEVDGLKAETSRFEETLKHREAEMKSRNKSHKAELKQLKADREAAVQDLQNDLDTVRADSSSLREELNKLQTESNASQENVKLIEDLREETEKLKLDFDSKFQLCQHDLDFYKAEASRLAEELNVCNTELTSLKAIASQFETNTKIHEDEMEKLKTAHNSEILPLQQNLESLKAEIAFLEEKLNISESNLKSSRENAGKIETNDEKYKEEIQRLKTDHSSNVELLTKDLAALNDEVTHLNESLQRSEAALKLSQDNAKEVEVQHESRVTELQAEVTELQAEVTTLMKTLKENQTAASDDEDNNKKELREISTEQEAKIQNLEKELSVINSETLSLRETLKVCQTELDEARNVIETFDGEKRQAEELIYSYESSADELLGKLKDVEANRSELNSKLSDMLKSCSKMEDSLETKSSELAAAELKSEQLLSDMNELNQVLKQRGETITKLKDIVHESEQTLRDSDSQLQSKTAALDAALNEIETLKAASDQLAKEVEAAKDMAEEAGKLRSRLAQMEKEFREHGDTTSEALSCSTLSRAEEVGRLRDVEDSFEERYTKLRAIAVRLKKRNAELLMQLEAERGRAQAMTAGARNVSALQAEYDKLQDVHDASVKELKSTKKRLEEAEQGAEAVKLCLDELKSENLQMTGKLEAANKSRVALETKMKELKSALDQVVSDCSDRDRQLAAATEHVSSESAAHAATRKRLEALTRETKRNTVQRLEMDDYERSVADLEEQLAAEKGKVAECEARAAAQADIAAGLREQVTLTQEAMMAEETRANELTDQLNTLRSRLSDAATQLSERDSEVLELRNDIETSRGDSERCRLQAAHLAAEKTRAEETIRAKAEALALQVRLLEDELKAAQSSDAQSTRELARISAEFEGYKVRAQSVLRQKARGDEPVAQEQGGEEVAQLRAALDACANKLQAASSKLSVSNEEATTLLADRDRVLAKCRQLSEQVTNLTTLNQQLTTSAKAAATEHKDAVARQKIHFEILLSNCRAQLQEVEDRLTGDNAILRDQLEKLEAKLSREKSARHPVGRAAESWTNSSAAFQPVRPGAETMSMVEREEGEGSESVDSSSPHLNTSKERHELMSLEKLLASTDGDNTESTTSPGTEMARARERLSVAEQQVRHLSSLLAEAEQDLARLTQLNEVLKEEIRRNQRSDEREKHAHNQEYLKNIVFKFVTLHSGDERSRLVPVLNTILKLSPAEASQLASVAKGGDAAGAARGWGSYLFN